MEVTSYIYTEVNTRVMNMCPDCEQTFKNHLINNETWTDENRIEEEKRKEIYI